MLLASHAGEQSGGSEQERQGDRGFAGVDGCGVRNAGAGLERQRDQIAELVDGADTSTAAAATSPLADRRHSSTAASVYAGTGNDRSSA